ncbi:hypothetical protein DOY81_002594 [Sarcophaga bullata]|nr:hypothetical protein DOY81_002594 [Sarcophaga bullata]
MAFKFVIVLSLVALASAGDYEYNKPPANNNKSAEDASNQHLDASTPVQHDNTYQSSNANDKTSYDDITSPSSYSTSIDNSYNQPPAQSYQSPISDDYSNSQYGYNYNPVGYYPPAKYDYSYSVNDPTTGDIKSHSESRDGYYVRGAYSLVDPDGFKRTVTYTADNVNGFNAVVNREPFAIQYSAPVEGYKASGAVNAASEVKENQNNLQEKDSYSSPPAQDGKGPYA